MNPIVKNVLVFIGGIAVGMIVNMGLVQIGASVIPLPEGASNATMDELRESMVLMENKHFIFPFLAHALGTLCGAWFVGKFAATLPLKLALGVGFFFLLGGLTMIYQVGGPTWFKALDLLLAYLPAAWLGGTIGIGSRK